MLDFAMIQRAQANDLDAITAVIDHTESLIEAQATKAAVRICPGGVGLVAYRDEFIQVGRIAVWEAIGRFTDTTVDAFERYCHTTLIQTCKDAVRRERGSGAGADANAMKTFAAMVEAADGDAFAAEKMVQTLPPKGRRLSADRANAARLAWQGTASLDKPIAMGDGDTGSLADFLTLVDAPDEEIRPKVGHGAALEALQVLKRYADVTVDRMTPGAFAANLPALVDVLEDTVTLPRDPQTRRYVLDAMRVLRAAVSVSTEGALDDDLRDVSDDRRADSAEKHERVTAVLNSLTDSQRTVLKHSFGIDGVSEFGWGEGSDVAGLAAHMGITENNMKVTRNRARNGFAKRFVAAVRLAGAEAFAAVLEAAAASMLKQGGRK